MRHGPGRVSEMYDVANSVEWFDQLDLAREHNNQEYDKCFGYNGRLLVTWKCSVRIGTQERGGPGEGE